MEGMSVLEGSAAGSAKVGQMERDPKRQRGPREDDRSNIEDMECDHIKTEINGIFEQNNEVDMSMGNRKLDGGTLESGRNWMSSGDNTNGEHRPNDGAHARGDSTHDQFVGRSTVGREGDGASGMPGKSKEPQSAIQMQAYQFGSSCMNANPTHQQGAIDRLRQQMGALESPVLLPIMQRAEPSPSTSLMNYGVSDAQRRGKVPDQGNTGRGMNPNSVGAQTSGMEMHAPSGDVVGGMYGGEAMHGHVQASAQAAANAGFYYPWAYNAQAYGMMSQQLQQHQSQQQQRQQPKELEDAGRRRKSSVAESDIEDAHQQRMDRIQTEDGKPRREMAANDDGYNWRKYGEKQVKGSKFPRSYYKCSHQGCPMKKIVERDPISGIISQSVVKGGNHTHPRPNAARTDVSNILLTQNGVDNSIRDDEAAGTRSKWRKSIDSEEHGTDSHKLDGTKLDRAESSDIIGDIQHSPQIETQEHIERKEDMKEAAVMALQLLGTGFSPDVGALGPGMASTPASLIPLPPTLRASPLNVKQKQAKNHFNSRGHSLYTVYSSPMKESEIPKDMLDHGEVNSEDEWETCEADFGVEDDETVSAAIAAATAFVCKEFKQDVQDAALRKPDAKKGSGPDALQRDDEPSPKKKSKKLSKKSSDGDKTDAQKNDEHKTVIQTETDSDQLEDGYRWRKYGQKVVKGNPHPRSYYKCTHQGCKVRKQVERSGDNVRVLITTYEGSHTHDPPPGGKTQQRRPSPPNRKPNTPTGQHLLGTSMSPTLQSYLSLANNGTFPLLLAPPSFMMGQGFQGLPLMSSPQQQQQASDQLTAMIASMNGDGAQASAPGDHLISLQNAAQQRIQAQLAQAQAFQAALSRSPAALHALQMLQGQVQQDTEEKQGAQDA